MKILIKIFLFNISLLYLNCYAQQPGWEIISSGTTTNLNSVFFFNYEVGYACGDSGRVIFSIDSGKTWQTLQTPVTTNLNDLYLFDENTLCAVGESGTIIFTTDGGTEWFGNTGFLLTENYYSVSFSGDRGICGGSSQTILYARFEGTSITWTVFQSGYFGGGFWGANMLSPQIGFIAGENSIFQPLLGRTTDSGLNWNFTAFYLNNNEGRATGIEFTDILTGYVSASVWNGQGAIAKTTDGGNNWISILFDYPFWDIDFPISNASLIGYAVGSEGTIFKTYNAGFNWQSQESGTILRLNKVHFIDLDFGFIVGENGLILRTTNGGEYYTQVEEPAYIPNVFKLEQNYPNPFNPTTKIRFSLTPSLSPGERVSEGRVRATLKVYDILGNENATLIDEEKPAGSYEVEFNAAGLPSGIYFYKLRAGDFIETKKMLLLK